MGISLFLPSVSALRLTELMYNPDYAENYNEWIELYNDERSSIDLSDYLLCGKSLQAGFVDRSAQVNDDRGLTLSPGAYVIITDGGSGTEVYEHYDVEDSALAFHVDGASICGGLGNEGDSIVIGVGDETVIDVSYGNDADPGFSLELVGTTFVSGTSLDGTPGRARDEESLEEGSREVEEEDDEAKAEPTNVRSFVPHDEALHDSAVTLAPTSEKKKIVLGAKESVVLPDHTSYLTREGRVRQTVIYAFAGFCIVLTILIALKKV